MSNPSDYASAAANPAGLMLDPQEFLHFLDDCDWTEEQKSEFIAELWKIVVGFVDLGIGIHPIQQVTDDVTLASESAEVIESAAISKNDNQENALSRQFGGLAEERIHGKP